MTEIQAIPRLNCNANKFGNLRLVQLGNFPTTLTIHGYVFRRGANVLCIRCLNFYPSANGMMTARHLVVLTWVSVGQNLLFHWLSFMVCGFRWKDNMQTDRCMLRSQRQRLMLRLLVLILLKRNLAMLSISNAKLWCHKRWCRQFVWEKYIACLRKDLQHGRREFRIGHSIHTKELDTTACKIIFLPWRVGWEDFLTFNLWHPLKSNRTSKPFFEFRRKNPFWKHAQRWSLSDVWKKNRDLSCPVEWLFKMWSFAFLFTKFESA